MNITGDGTIREVSQGVDRDKNCCCYDKRRKCGVDNCVAYKVIKRTGVHVCGRGNFVIKGVENEDD